MKEGTILLLLFALLGTTSALSFYGDSTSFMPLQEKSDGTFAVSFYHRQNGRGICQDQSSLWCDSGVCTSFDQSSVLQTDQDDAGQGRWCQSEGLTTAVVKTNETSFSLSNSGCCWVSNINGKTTWTTQAELDLGIRSDSRGLNRCPVTTTVSSLRVPQNCFIRLRILAYDPDGDHVKCSFSSNATVPSNFTLDEDTCTLTSTGNIDIGVQVFEVMLKDFPTENISLTYADGSMIFYAASDTTTPPLCSLKLQFSMEILPPIPTCEAGHVQPMFLPPTPSYGDVLYASVGHTVQIYVQAQAHQSSINDFQFSGPQNMTKAFKNDLNGVAEVTLSWTPQQSDLYRFVPVCFTAETHETQSAMRCVVIMVTKSPFRKGKTTIQCLPNQMTVILDITSIPGIDVNYLKLNDPSCSLTSNNTHIMGTMSFSTCGTKLEDQDDYIVFKNEINSFELPEQIITRRQAVKIGFSCKFPKTMSISSYYTLQDSDLIFTESSFGSFSYSFNIFYDNNFTQKVEASAYPFEVQLLQNIYMGIQAQSDLSNVTLFVESCKATPDDNPDNTLSYTFIKNGCIEDGTLEVYQPNQTSYNFKIEVFKFTGDHDQVYITCSVILCETGNPFSRCALGCLKNPARRRRRELSKETNSHYIIQGPLKFVEQAIPIAAADDNRDVMKKNEEVKSDKPAAVSPPPVSPDTKSSEEGWKIKQIFNTNISTMVFAGGFIASLIAMAVIFRYLRRKKKAEEHNVLIVSEWEN